MILAGPVNDCEIFYEYNYSESIAYHGIEVKDGADANTREVPFSLRYFLHEEPRHVCSSANPGKNIIILSG